MTPICIFNKSPRHIYETQWLDEYDDAQGHKDWWDARTRANDDERRRHEAHKAKSEQHKRAISQKEGGEDTPREQATDSDDTTPERHKHKKPRGGDDSDERDENADATTHGKGKKRMASTMGERDASTDAEASKAMTPSDSDIEESPATPESLPSTPEARPRQAKKASRQPEQELVGGTAAQADEGRRCATTTDAPRRSIKRAACAENEHDGAATLAGAATMDEGGAPDPAGQTGAATDGNGGAARAAVGAEPTKKKKKSRRPSKTGSQQRKAQKNKAAAAQGDRAQTNTQ